MTPAQQKELARLTPAMWAVLRCARRHGESDPWLCGPMVRTANILARRGFLKIQHQPKGFYSTQLTNAGTEVLLIDSRTLDQSRSEQ